MRLEERPAAAPRACTLARLGSTGTCVGPAGPVCCRDGKMMTYTGICTATEAMVIGTIRTFLFTLNLTNSERVTTISARKTAVLPELNFAHNVDCPALLCSLRSICRGQFCTFANLPREH